MFAKFYAKQQSWWHVMTSRICWQQTINIELDFYCDKDKLISLNRAHYIHFFFQTRAFYSFISLDIILFTFRGLAPEASWRGAHFSSEPRGNERLALNIYQPRSQPRLLRILSSTLHMKWRKTFKCRGRYCKNIIHLDLYSSDSDPQWT